MPKKRQHQSTNKVRRVAPRPRNQPKPVDDGMQHFLVSVPRQADPIVDQATRERVASTIEASLHPQRFADIEEAANAVPTVTKLAPDPDDVAASMRRLHEKLGISSPADIEPPSPDYEVWFQPIEHSSDGWPDSPQTDPRMHAWSSPTQGAFREL